MPQRFELIYKFCVEFYAQLINQNTVIDSFKRGKEVIKKDENYMLLKVSPKLLTNKDSNITFFR